MNGGGGASKWSGVACQAGSVESGKIAAVVNTVGSYLPSNSTWFTRTSGTISGRLASCCKFGVSVKYFL